jgi:hypothetical protein
VTIARGGSPLAWSGRRQEELEVGQAPDKYSRLDIMLPSQYFGTVRKLTPEQRLMIAVLDDAIDCLEKYRLSSDRESRQLFDEAEQWLLASETNWPYSFRFICSFLNLDAGAVLRNLNVR